MKRRAAALFFVALVALCAPALTAPAFAISSNAAEVTPTTTTVTATVSITPVTYNMKRNGKYIGAKLALAGSKVANIDSDSIMLHVVVGDNDTAEGVSTAKEKEAGGKLNIKFDSREVKELITNSFEEIPETVTLSVTGSINNSETSFRATDTINIINQDKGKGK